MTQDNPFAKGLSTNEDWVGEKDEARKYVEDRVEKIRHRISKVTIELTDRTGLPLMTPEE